MSDEEDVWIKVVNKKRERRANRSYRQKYISEQLAYKLQKDLDITGLAEVLLSTESRNLQEDGWCFDRIIKTDEDSDLVDEPKDTDTTEYIWLPISNKWNDRALFSRKVC